MFWPRFRSDRDSGKRQQTLPFPEKGEMFHLCPRRWVWVDGQIRTWWQVGPWYWYIFCDLGSFGATPGDRRLEQVEPETRYYQFWGWDRWSMCLAYHLHRKSILSRTMVPDPWSYPDSLSAFINEVQWQLLWHSINDRLSVSRMLTNRPI